MKRLEFLPRISIFTALAFVVFGVGIFRNAHAIGETYAAGIPVKLASGDGHASFIGLRELAVVMSVLFGIRLYIHAWVIDESVKFREAVRALSIGKKIIEWILRACWVAGTAFLPECHGIIDSLSLTSPWVNVHLYVAIIFGCVLIWDCMMISTIKHYTDLAPAELTNNYVLPDSIMFGALALSWLLIEVKGDLGNWQLFLAPFALAICFSISLYELCFWGNRVRKEISTS